MVSQQHNLDMLPSEVIENIVSYCDGSSLGNLMKTCKRLKQCIENPNKFISKKWRSVCKHEMEQDFIIDILQNLYPKYWLDEVVCWKTVYTSWRKWSCFNDWIPIVKTFLKKTKNCTSSVKISGNWIFIATKNEGVLEAINYITDEKVLLFQCNSVNDMYLKCHVKKKETDDVILQNVEHDEVVLQLLRYNAILNLHTGETRIQHKTYNYLALKHFEAQEVTVTNVGSPSSVCNLNVMNNKKTVTQRKEWMVCNIVQIWDNRILLLDYDEKKNSIGTFEVTDYNFKTVDHPLTGYKIDMFKFLYSPLKNYHLGVFIVTNRGDFEIMVNGRKRRYQTSSLPCEILCTHYYAGLLFLGSSIGTIYIYRVSCDMDLLNIRLLKYDGYLDVCSEAILSIDVKDRVLNPMIVAGSEHKIYLIRLD